MASDKHAAQLAEEGLGLVDRVNEIIRVVDKVARLENTVASLARQLEMMYSQIRSESETREALINALRASVQSEVEEREEAVSAVWKQILGE